MQNDIGDSPLITASGHGHVALCKLLIERGATVDNQTKVRLLYRHVHYHCGIDRMVCSIKNSMAHSHGKWYTHRHWP